MSALLFKKLRKPGYASTLMAGLLSNMLVFAEPVSRAATNLLNDAPEAGAGSFATSTTGGAGTLPGPEWVWGSPGKPAVATAPVATPKAALEETPVFYADQEQGAIGVTESHRADNPRDNYFTITLPNDIDWGLYTPVLEYSLYGLATASGTTKSINGSAAYGGASLENTQTWQSVKEYVPPTLLRAGTNEVFFNRRMDKRYDYQVKDLKIKLYPKPDAAILSSKEEVSASMAADRYPEAVQMDLGQEAASEALVYDAFEVLPSREGMRTSEGVVTVRGLHFKDVKPLEQELVNVTSGSHSAYRMGGEVSPGKGPLTVAMDYDTEKIPEGYTAKDVRTFYYAKDEQRWKALQMDAVDMEKGRVLSFVEDPGGETDYINGILKVPEQPETAGFAPTAMSDMEFADPSAGVVSIAPPSPNNTGSVTTGFPLKLPAGRNGMQPSLEVSYNSDGGNGWMGVGWGINIPSISLNTKWGVPVFDDGNDAMETELYTLNGQDLVLEDGPGNFTNPHRDADIQREDDRRFYLRKEGSYLEVIRHGDGPKNYYWEVTDKQGNKSYYGGITSPDIGSSLSDNASDTGNKVHWALVRQEDPYGNYVEYNYDKQWETVNDIEGWGFYLKTIKYAMHSAAGSKHYEVSFERASGREDISASARNGVFQVTKDVLEEVTVSYVDNGVKELIRRYAFTYTEAAFKKQLLEEIAEYDSEDNLFYSNTMEYYDDVGSNDIIKGTSTAWEGDSETIQSPLHNLAPFGLGDEIPKGSALGTSTTTGGSLGLRGGVGIDFNAVSVGLSVGGGYNGSRSTQDARISFMDVNGDGLPDKVFSNNDGVYYRPNTGDGFGNTVPISGIDRMSETKSRTNGFGLDANAYIIGVGYSESKTTTETDHYFVDFNGDGLPDVVTGSRVKFNTTQPDGDYTWRNFTDNVSISENPIVSGVVNEDIIDFLDLETLKEIRSQYPQFDHVKVWKAPYTGQVDITGSATLVTQNDCENQEEDNLFRYTIERTPEVQDSLADIIKTGNTDSIGTVSMVKPNVMVAKGDLLFFRVHNKEYGCGGEVEWNPQVVYNSVNNPGLSDTDEHDKLLLSFDSEEDYVMINGGGWKADPDETNVDIELNLEDQDFSAYEFSDDIEFIVEKIKTDVSTGESEVETGWPKKRVLNHDTGTFSSSGNSITTNMESSANYDYSLRFYAKSSSNVAWGEIGWKPTIEGASDTYYPSVDYLNYDDNITESIYWTENDDLPQIVSVPSGEEEDTLVVMRHNLFDFPVSAPTGIDGIPTTINWVVKEAVSDTTRVLYKKKFYLIEDNQNLEFSKEKDFYVPVSDSDEEFMLTKEQVNRLITEDGRLYAAFYVDNPEMEVFDEGEITYELGDNIDPMDYSSWDPEDATITTPYLSLPNTFFGNTYRGWGQFLYNGGIGLKYDSEGTIIEEYEYDGAINIKILENNTVEEQGDADDLEDDIEEDDPDTVGGDIGSGVLRYTFYDQENEYTSFINNGVSGARYGYNTNHDLTVDLGRFGNENLYDIYLDPDTILEENDGSIFVGLKQRSRSKGIARSMNAGLPEMGGAGTASEATTDVMNQYVDMNGDRYPDIVTKGMIQYTHMRGGLSEKKLVNTSNIIYAVSGNRSEDEIQGVTISGMYPNSTATDNGRASDNKTVTNANSGINDTEGKSFDSRQLLDINGDGLTDVVWIYKERIDVKLNTGYGFTDTITWADGYSSLLTSTRSGGGVSTGGGSGTSGSLGADADFNASYGGGFGAGTSTANMKTSLVDVNGDGLPDLLLKTGADVEYFLNTGTGFDSTPKSFYGNIFQSTFDQDHSLTGNLFGSGTAGVTISFALINLKFIGTVSASGNASFNEKRATVQDIDGDGLPDVLYKVDGEDNADVRAHLNRVGKTNLLKRVHTPMGGSWTVEYEQKGNTYAMPQRTWVMRSLATHDGFTEDTAYGPDESLTKFEYEDGYHDRRERVFYGFETVTIGQYDPSDESLYRYTVKKYHNDNYYFKGAEKEQVTYTDTDDELSRTRRFYNLRQPDASFSSVLTVDLDEPHIESTISTGELDRTRALPVLVKTISTTYEDGQSLNLVQDFKEYDAWGNITHYLNHGAGPDSAYETIISYDDTDYPGVPTDIQVYESGGGSSLLRHREATYTAEGKIHQIITHLNGSDTNTIEMEYDVFGNTEKVHQLDNMDQAGTNHFTQEITYDSEVHTYPVAMSDSFGQSSSSEYDYRFGVPVLVTDMNGNEMRTYIDNRGRMVEITSPNEMPNGWTIRKEYKGGASAASQVSALQQGEYVVTAQGSFPAATPGDPLPEDAQHYAVTRHFDPLNTNNEMLTISIVDGFGQAVQLKKSHNAVTGTSGTPAMKWMVNGFEEKDAFGRVVKSYLSDVQADYPSNLNSLSAAHLEYYPVSPGSLPDPVEITYDHRNRETTVRQPGEGQYTELEYTVDSGMYLSTVTNELGQTEATYTDVRGRKRKVVQNGEITTEFTYNTVDELVEVENTAGFKTQYEYDLAGRRTEEKHPDRGYTTFSYDNAGNMVEKQTANLMQSGSTGIIKYHYDHHRLLEVEYPHHPENNVTYEYGTSSGSPNGVGRLVQQEDATGIQLFGYGKLGELTHQTRSIAVAGKKSYWFTTQWEYDSWNRLREITYPDADTVTYHYDNAGQLESVTSGIATISTDNIVNEITYTKYGERNKITYGNGTVTQYDYDLRRRMDHLEHEFTDDPVSSSTYSIEKAYSYDVLSNIEAIETTNVTNSIPAGGKLAGPMEHNYVYDDYNRLVHAEGYYVGPDDKAPDLLKQAYTLDMYYDDSHNITRKEQTHQFGTVGTYGDPLPTNADHAPATSYALDYEDYSESTQTAGGYGYSQPHAPQTIVEYPNENYSGDPNDPRIKRRSITYDANGNQKEIKKQVSDPDAPVGSEDVAVRENLWDEEDRLLAVDLNPEADSEKPEVAVYTYDAGGERTIRYVPGRFDAYYSAKDAGSSDRQEAILYPNPLVTVKTLPLPESMPDVGNATITKYTKHYYIGSERISSALGSIKTLGLLCESTGGAPQWLIDAMNSKVDEAGNAMSEIYTEFDKTLDLTQPFLYNGVIRDCNKAHDQEMYAAYWYHPDHLGSSSYISNQDGEISQHMEYLPFGETLAEEHLNSNNSPFKFNAKELDAETGNYYYGARYYDAKWSLMLSVDQMYDKYPSFSPYAYTLQNPVGYTDPTGMTAESRNDIRIWGKDSDDNDVLVVNLVTDKIDTDIRTDVFVPRGLGDLVKGHDPITNKVNETESGAIIEKDLDPVLERIISKLPDKNSVPMVSVGAEGVLGKGSSFSFDLAFMHEGFDLNNPSDFKIDALAVYSTEGNGYGLSVGAGFSGGFLTARDGGKLSINSLQGESTMYTFGFPGIPGGSNISNSVYTGEMANYGEGGGLSRMITNSKFLGGWGNLEKHYKK